jgi:hypothetical protein
VFTVGLSDVDREKLTKLISTGTHPARMIMRARVLLELDENAGPVPDRAVIAQPGGCCGEHGAADREAVRRDRRRCRGHD